MAKFIKFGLISLVLLIVLFISAAVVLVATVDPNEYKSEIAQEVQKATGRELIFEGDIEFNFLPWLGLKVGPVALGNRDGFTPAEMLRINKAEAGLDILPLLSGNLSVSTLVLDGFTLNLAIDENGDSNWADLSKGTTSPAPQPEKQSAEEPSTVTFDPDSIGLESITIGGMEITNANITYNDRKTGKEASITNLNFLVGSVADKTRTPMEMAFDLKLNDPPIETRPTMKATLFSDKSAQRVELTDLTFTLLNMVISGNFFAMLEESGLNYSGELAIAEMSLKDLMQQLKMDPIQTTDPAALTRFSSLLKIDGDTQAVLMEKLEIKLDDTTISGHGSVTNFSKPAIMVATNIDRFDADRYLPPAMTEKKEEQPSTSSPSTTPAQEPDLTGLKELDFESRLTIGEIKAMNLKVTDILCETVIRGGVISVKPFKATLYEGAINTEALMDVRNKVAVWREKGSMVGVQAGPMILDYSGSDRITGSANAKFDVRGKGLLPDNIKKSVTGKASFALKNGVIYGININKMLQDGLNTLLRRPESEDEPAKTDFAEITGSADIQKGRIDNRDLVLKNPLIRVNGEGWADLPSNQVDYKATATVVGTMEGQEGESVDELFGMPIPIYIRGDMNDPVIRPDMKEFGSIFMNSKYKKKTEELVDEYSDKASGFGSDMKDKLFGSDEVDENGEKKDKGFLGKFF